MADNTSGFGLELIEQAALKIIYNELNNELALIEEAWKAKDLELNQLIGADPIEVTLERIEDGSFYQGHVPSLIEAPIDKYPNVAVICGDSNPYEGENDYDQFNNYTNSLAIEIMCKSLYNESEVNRRTNRTLEAVHNVMMRNTTLDGIIEGFDSDPSAIVTDVFTRRDREQGESDWYWRAGRIDYQITRQAKIPEN
jgi:hypothetical protein